jgi:8-oxo-dGTP diphosphatase
VTREYPPCPIVGVGGVVVQDGRALIVKRAHEPRKGEWSLPGGIVELGETLVDAVRREIREETGLEVAVGDVVEVFDRIHRDGTSVSSVSSVARIQYHFVIVDYLCRPTGGTLRAADDADDVAWVASDDLERYGVNEFAARVIRRGLDMARNR